MTDDAVLASSLRISVMRLARRLRQERGDHALSLTQLSALASLDRRGPSTPGALAAHERVRPPSMTRVIAALEELGLVGRQPHPSDGRQIVVDVTPAGRALLRADRRRREAWLARVLDGLSPRERSVLRDAAPVLAKLAES